MVPHNAVMLPGRTLKRPEQLSLIATENRQPGCHVTKGTVLGPKYFGTLEVFVIHAVAPDYRATRTLIGAVMR
jgi:hypothetical protein